MSNITADLIGKSICMSDVPKMTLPQTSKTYTLVTVDEMTALYNKLEKRFNELEKYVQDIDDDLANVETKQVSQTKILNSLIEQAKTFMTETDRQCLIEIFEKYKVELESFMEKTNYTLDIVHTMVTQNGDD